MTAAPLYAGLAGLLFLALSLNAIRARGASGVMLGTGGDARLERAVRVHGNFAEYVPIVLVLLLVVELSGGPRWALHLSGVSLLLGRVLHAVSIAAPGRPMALRAGGMALTFLPLGLLSVLALLHAF